MRATIVIYVKPIAENRGFRQADLLLMRTTMAKV
jgi:hypothetical protein